MYDPTTGRFSNLDPFAGNLKDPQSLHKYAYTHDDPVTNIDPTGEYALIIQMAFASTATADVQVSKAQHDLEYGAKATLMAFGLMIVAGEVIRDALGWEALAELGLAEALIEAEGEAMIKISQSKKIKELGKLLKTNAKPIGKEIKKTRRKTGRRDDKLPVFFDVEALWPEPYALDVKHLTAKPIHYMLHYRKKDAGEKKKLRLALGAKHAKKAVNGKEMHEFPFNATREADVDVSSVEWVDPIQNHTQGSLYFGNWFVRRQLKNKNGAAFLVVPIPGRIFRK